MKNEEMLGKEKMWKLMLKMTIPTILAQVVNLLYNIVDRIYIGNMNGIGSDCLAGLSLCSPIIILISAFSAFAYGGGAPLASKSLGEKDLKKAHMYLGNSTFLLIGFAVILSIVAYIFKKPILYLVGASDNTFSYANDYLSIYLAGTLFVQITFGLTSFMTAQGKSKNAMIATAIGAIMNIALDPLFIFAFHLGIRGAAIATVISQFASSIYTMIILTGKNVSLRILPKYMKPDIHIIGSIMALGVASFVMASTESLIGFVLNGKLHQYGGDIHVSNLAILQSVMMLISTPMAGFCQGVTPILSFNYGAKNKERLKDCYFKTLLVCVLICTTGAILSMIFPRVFARMFTGDDDLLDLAQKYLPIFIAGMLIFGIQRACQTTFVALGQAPYALFIAMLRKVILLVPLAIILPIFFGVSGIYYAEAIADATAATICGTVFLFRFRKILSKMPDTAPSQD